MHRGQGEHDDTVAGLAGRALRTARSAKGLSQAELARRSGVPRTVIVEVEGGRRQPSLPTLARLLAGAGYRPTLGLGGGPAAPAGGGGGGVGVGQAGGGVAPL